MALSAIKTWGEEILFSSDLNAEFANIRNNALALVSPWTGDMAAGGYKLTGLGLGSSSAASVSLTGTPSTGMYFGSASRVDFATSGTRAGGFSGGIFHVGATLFTTGAASGDIVLGATSNIRSVNNAGTDTVRLISLQVGNIVHIAQGGNEIQWGRALVPIDGGGATLTLGVAGGQGPATDTQFGFLVFKDSTGTTGWIPTWR